MYTIPEVRDSLVEKWAHKAMTADFAFCSYHKDGTSISREPRQAYETPEVGHSQLCGSHGID